MTQLIFAGESARDRYSICYCAIVLSNRQAPVSDWDTIIDVLRKLKSIGSMVAQKIGDTTIYELATPKEDTLHQTIEVDKAGLVLLIDYIESPIWKVGAIERVADCRNWLKELQGAK